jgi:hypothetical protein
MNSLGGFLLSAIISGVVGIALIFIEFRLSRH